MRTIFASDSIIIRPFQVSDTLSLFDAVKESVDTVRRWLPWCQANYSSSDAEAWVEFCEQSWMEKREFPFAIIDSTTSEFLGSVGINQINKSQNFGNIGYWVRTTYERQGIASAAVRLVAKFGFSELELSRLEIIVLTENQASRRVAEKVNATFEGIARNRIVMGGKSHNAAIYSLVPSDLR